MFEVWIERLSWPHRPLLQQWGFAVAPAQVLAIMGPSGCGKSTLLSVLAGTIGLGQGPEARPAWSGSIRCQGQELSTRPAWQRGIGLMWQDDVLFPHLSVAGNLLFALPAGPMAHRRAVVHEALCQAGLDGWGDRDPATLSGGQRARVSLLRTLLAQPRVLLLDEPFARLDPTLRRQFRDWVWSHVATRGLPVVLVTHDVNDVPPGAQTVEWPDV